MTAIAASAPGKAVLCGEYAVLEGAPAIVMAVDRRARVRIEATTEPFHTVSAPGLHERGLRFGAPGDGSITWLEEGSGAAGFELLEHVWRSVGPSPSGGLALSLDTRRFFYRDGGPKLGFGSSAALAVALTAALAGEGTGAEGVGRMATEAHRKFQQGQGSGVDVASAVHGGVIGYFMEHARTVRLDWPPGLHFVLLWSGAPASTARALARLAAAGRRPAAAVLADAAALVFETWSRGPADAILDSLRAYAGALRRFGVDHDLGVFDGGHRQLYEEALRQDVVYKPCGAGGGDIGIVFAVQRAAAERFAGWATQCGFQALQVLPEPRGVLREGGAER
jgi:phosphomevalonate kinase